ncbi:endo-1,4-beta-xylanase [Paenibacillus lactis]|uniref:endo-1,4-beta-xylanase n=1 Tax=Paenibacillus lactis TaxID=228574 RepID=UPI00368C3266
MLRMPKRGRWAATAVAAAVAASVVLLFIVSLMGNRDNPPAESQVPGKPGEGAAELRVDSEASNGKSGAELPAGNNQPASTEPQAQQSVLQDIPSLHELFEEDFPIGAAIEPNQTNGPSSELLKKHVRWLVAENVMKPDAIQPSEGQFIWTHADRIVEFAKENNMQVRFHTLVWHTQVGEWFFQDAEGKPMVDETDPKRQEANKKLLLQRLDTHVRTIVGRYKDEITSWDVVNEVIEPGDPDGMRASEWYKIAGTDYIATAFRAAREAGGPEAKLYINDYGTDNPVKRDRLYQLVKDLLEQGVPIDGVGHQTHIDIYGPSVDSIIASMRKFAELGLDNLVTELDMSIYAWNDRSDYGQDLPQEILNLQADRYGELFKAFRQNKDILSGVVFWGIADDHTWLHDFPVARTNAPLLFDRQHQPKPAFWAVVKAARSEL